MIYCYYVTEKPKYCQQYLVIFPAIYSLHIQLKSDVIKKTWKLQQSSEFLMALAVVTLDVLGETFSFHPTLYMYICVQIIQVKIKIQKTASSKISKPHYLCFILMESFFLGFAYYAATLKTSIQSWKWQFMMKTVTAAPTFWAELLYHCCL